MIKNPSVHVEAIYQSAQHELPFDSITALLEYWRIKYGSAKVDYEAYKLAHNKHDFKVKF